MALDLFGLGKDKEQKEPPAPAPAGAAPVQGAASSAAAASARRTWSRLLLIDVLALLGFGAAFVLRARDVFFARPVLPVAALEPAPKAGKSKHKKHDRAADEGEKPAAPPAAEKAAAEPPKAPAPPLEEAAPEPKSKHKKGKTPPPAPAAPAEEPASKTPKGKHKKGKTASETAKSPVGSPAVNAPEVPAHRATPDAETAPAAPRAGAAPAAPRAGAAPEKPAKKPGVKPVDFTYNDPSAKEVDLSGAFLVRSGGKKRMTKNSEGVWELTIYLNGATTYGYRFIVTGADGKRVTTPKQSLEVP
ncbi:MAG TPA: hypothetical protein VNI01_05670 [Elusimicrobiota bacterium]|nr:hypothetical protein [Elusimicrobiota bacterium]